MNTPLNINTHQKARDLARKITVAHDLDPDIQEELYGHIEDKLLAYKSGEERVSDEDAFILVREHFGDAKVLASMFAEVHEEAATYSLLRRTGAAIIVTLATAWLCSVLALPFQFAALRLLASGVHSEIELFVAMGLQHVMLPVLPVGVASALYFWRRRVEAGKRPWFLRWSPRTFLRYGALLLAAVVFTPSLRLPPELLLTPEAAWRTAANIVTILGWFGACGLCVAWLWWCGADLRRPHSVVLCLGAWTATHVALNLSLVELCLVREVLGYKEIYPPSISGSVPGWDSIVYLLTRMSLWGEQLAFSAPRFEVVNLNVLRSLLVQASALALFGLVVDVATRQFTVKPTPERELVNSNTKLRTTAFLVCLVALSHLMFEQSGLTVTFLQRELLMLAMMGSCAFINGVSIPRAIAQRKLHRVRALRLASNVLFMVAIFLPMRLVNPKPLTNDLSTTFAIMVIILSVTGTLVAAWINWRKRNEIYRGQKKKTAGP